MPPDLALLSTLDGSNYPCLELIFMVPKVFEPLKFDFYLLTICLYFREVSSKVAGNTRLWCKRSCVKIVNDQPVTVKALSAKLAVNE